MGQVCVTTENVGQICTKLNKENCGTEFCHSTIYLLIYTE